MRPHVLVDLRLIWGGVLLGRGRSVGDMGGLRLFGLCLPRRIGYLGVVIAHGTGTSHRGLLDKTRARVCSDPYPDAEPTNQVPRSSGGSRSKTSSRPVTSSTLRTLGCGDATRSDPPDPRQRLSPAMRTLSPVESRKVTSVRSTMI